MKIRSSLPNADTAPLPWRQCTPNTSFHVQQREARSSKACWGWASHLLYMCFPLSVENLGHIGAIKLGSTAEVLALTPPNCSCLMWNESECAPGTLVILVPPLTRQITKTLGWNERHFFLSLFFFFSFPLFFFSFLFFPSVYFLEQGSCSHLVYPKMEWLEGGEEPRKWLFVLGMELSYCSFLWQCSKLKWCCKTWN